MNGKCRYRLGMAIEGCLLKVGASFRARQHSVFHAKHVPVRTEGEVLYHAGHRCQRQPIVCRKTEQ
jgi:hypothetical protein